MSTTPKDNSKNPRRVPPPISFPLPSTIKPKGREPLKLDSTERIIDSFSAGSRNPIIEMADTDDIVNMKRDSNHLGFGKAD